MLTAQASRRNVGELARAIALASALVLALAPGAALTPSRAQEAPARDALATALAQALASAPAHDEVAAFYRSRGYRPLWITAEGPGPEARQLIDLLETAAEDGLDPDAYGPRRLAVELAVARAAGPRRQAQAELALSRAMADYVFDLRTPPKEAQLAFIDPEIMPAPLTRRRILQQAAWASSLSEHLAHLRRMNPLYEDYRQALAAHRTASGGAALERLILANMARARALPPDLGRRFVVVDAAGMTLRLYENGELVDEMPVAVGRRSAATPPLAGMIRYVRFNPYWNLPEDMVRREIAPRVLREGTGFLEAERMEALSDWSPSARVLHPSEVDWRAVAAGERPLRLRQLPGPHNILGGVKLMLPNNLGIYLHDTPDKSVFTRTSRTVSAGCVRLADAQRLTRRLMGWTAAAPLPEGLNQRVDLPEPIPVYIVYFTLAPEGGQLVRRPDIYGRDAPLIAQMAAQGRA